MIKSTGWKWNMVGDEPDSIWKTPSIESYYLLHRWKSAGMTEFLDLGCGLGRHSVLMGSYGFNVRCFDISPEAIERTKNAAESKGLTFDYCVGDMLELPYGDGSIDCVLCRNVISHTDTDGVRKTISEIYRVLKSGGECYATLASKSDRGFKESSKSVDENTKYRMEEGPEYMIPHFYTDRELTESLFSKFEIVDLQHIQTFYEVNGERRSAYHYHVLCRKKA